MFLMYVDESGDSGLINSPVRYFILSGLVLHELRWREFLDDLIQLRRDLRATKGLKLREEIHAASFINNPKELVRIKRNDRADILRQCIDWCSRQRDCNVINIVVDKNGKSEDVFELAWSALIQRFENTMRHRNFPGPANADERGIIISDMTDVKKLRTLIRKMRRYNLVPNTRTLYGSGSRNITIENIVEDPFFKDSADSFFHQMVDVIAYSTRQLYEPNAYMKKKGASRLFYKLEPILCKVASKTNPFGIVEL